MKKNAGYASKKLILALMLVLSMLLASCGIQIGEGEDDTPPSSPLLSVDEVGADGIRLVWSGSFDDGDIDEYRLYRDDKVIAKIRKTEYLDKEVEGGQEYEYSVLAVDEAGNKSDRSPAVKVTAGSQSARATDATKESTEPNATDKTKPGETSEPEPTAGPSAADGKLDILKLSKSSVKIYIIDDDYNIIATGSGTIIDEDGFILTNYHCVGHTADDTSGTGLYNQDGLVGVALTDDVKAYSQPQYFARFMGGDSMLDIAVVHLESDLNGNPISADMGLKPISMSDSDNVVFGEDVNVLGFPGVGGETITFTSGRVSGFMDDDGDSITDWIKTDALVNHGNSGGTALNGKGQMIGIPTAKVGGEDNDQMFFLRPVNLAIPIIEQAREAFANNDYPGNGRTGPTQTPTPTNPGGSGTTDAGSPIVFAGRVVDADTQAPIPDALVIALVPGVTTQQFLDEQLDSQVASYAYADADGYFACDPALNAQTTYAVIIWMDGYEPLLIDDALYMEDDGSGWYDVGDVYLTRSAE